MMRKYAKFAILMVIILGSLLWVALANVSGSKTYYVSIPELRQLGTDAFTKRVRVGGDVQANSIVRSGTLVRFNLVPSAALPGGAGDAKVLPVVYEGRDPLPDTFKDGAQALAGGKLDSQGVFHAQEVQAKVRIEVRAQAGHGSGWVAEEDCACQRRRVIQVVRLIRNGKSTWKMSALSPSCWRSAFRSTQLFRA